MISSPMSDNSFKNDKKKLLVTTNEPLVLNFLKTKNQTTIRLFENNFANETEFYENLFKFFPGR